jgi:glycine/D-amino acid oxidase-like deaminating enzyme
MTNPPMTGQHVLIVGAGAFGLPAALALHARGHRVTVLDAGPLPREAAASTDVSKVVRMDYGEDLQHTDLGARAIAGWERWNEEFGERLYCAEGFLVLTQQPLRRDTFEHDSYTALHVRGLPVERLDARSIAARYPAWQHAGLADGYFNPRAGWVRSRRVIEILAARATALGIELRAGTACAHLLEHGTRVHGVRTSTGEDLHADVVLVAAGAWTPFLLPELQPFLRATGQPVVHFQVDDPARWQAPRFPVFACDIATTGWYGFPALPDGALKIGNHGPGRTVHPDEPRRVLPAEVARARAFVAAMLPELAAAPVLRTRLCLYCDTPDGGFLIDWHRDRPGLAIASGDSGHGFKFAPVLGDVIADVVERRGNEFAARYAFGRKAGRRETARAR